MSFVKVFISLEVNTWRFEMQMILPAWQTRSFSFLSWACYSSGEMQWGQCHLAGRDERANVVGRIKDFCYCQVLLCKPRSRSIVDGPSELESCNWTEFNSMVIVRRRYQMKFLQIMTPPPSCLTSDNGMAAAGIGKPLKQRPPAEKQNVVPVV